MDWINLDQGGNVALCCLNNNELSSYIKCEEFLDYLRNCQLIEKNSTP